MSAKKPNLSHLEKHAGDIRANMAADRQNDVFEAAVEAGYLAAMADGTVDEPERAAIERAVGILSSGSVIEWETEALVDACKQRIAEHGEQARAKAVGARLKELGHAEAGLLVAAVVAHATGGIDSREAGVLETVGKAAGVGKGKVADILKRAGAELP